MYYLKISNITLAVFYFYKIITLLLFQLLDFGNNGNDDEVASDELAEFIANGEANDDVILLAMKDDEVIVDGKCLSLLQLLVVCYNSPFCNQFVI